MGRDLGLQCRKTGRRRRHRILAQLLIREIDGGLDVGPERHELVAPAVVEPMQPAFHLGERLAPLGFGFGRDQVGGPLRFREVEAAGLEGAPGELAGLGRAQAGDRSERIAERGDDGGPAMHVKLRHVLAGGAGGRGKPER